MIPFQGIPHMLAILGQSDDPLGQQLKMFTSEGDTILVLQP